jgi:hypothetical protein
MMLTTSVTTECSNEVHLDMIWEKISILRPNNSKHSDLKNIEDTVRTGVIIIQKFKFSYEH